MESKSELVARITRKVHAEYEGEDTNQAFIDAEIQRQVALFSEAPSRSEQLQKALEHSVGSEAVVVNSLVAQMEAHALSLEEAADVVEMFSPESSCKRAAEKLRNKAKACREEILLLEAARTRKS